ncbi:hypothetical protein Ahy_B06g083886 [Arachis hypogaea]|uniref:Uncharacterized protein n=1 Tax=Arachis hypogaea TaxID=3818 RepID=A0A444YQU0_ARAHY|nr:hypothetical protein Ahy_B06g083886 [Arachis hypogaea]
MVVDLGETLCSWMPCVHVCVVLAKAGKYPDEFCHKWLTIDAYNDTYAFHLNPIPGQAMWEKSPFNRLQAPKFKKMPGASKKKCRKDADEGPEKAHTKRNCSKRKAEEAAAAAAKGGNSNPTVPTTAAPVVNPAHAIPPADVPYQVGAPNDNL